MRLQCDITYYVCKPVSKKWQLFCWCNIVSMLFVVVCYGVVISFPLTVQYAVFIKYIQNMFSHALFCLLEWSKLPFNQFLGPFLLACATDLLFLLKINSLLLQQQYNVLPCCIYGQKGKILCLVRMPLISKTIFIKMGRNVYSYSFKSH